MMRYIIACFILISSLHLNGQVAYLEARFVNDFTQWRLLNVDEELIGTLETRFMGESEIQEWNVELNGEEYLIESVWPDRMDEWVMRSDENEVRAAVEYTNDYSSWSLSDDNYQFTLRGDLPTNLNAWYLESNEVYWEMYTAYPNQFSSWFIDNRETEISTEMEIMLLFVSSFMAVRLE